MPKFLPFMNIRNVNFDDRVVKSVECVKDRNRGMSKRTRIDDDASCDLPCLVNPIDDLILTIALMKAYVELEFGRKFAAIGLNIGQSFMAINSRLSLTQEIKIGSV